MLTLSITTIEWGFWPSNGIIIGSTHRQKNSTNFSPLTLPVVMYTSSIPSQVLLTLAYLPQAVDMCVVGFLLVSIHTFSLFLLSDPISSIQINISGLNSDISAIYSILLSSLCCRAITSTFLCVNPCSFIVQQIVLALTQIPVA